MKMPRGLSKSSKLFIALAVSYLALAFILPANRITTADYQITDLQYAYLLLVARLPIVALWLIAFYSYRTLSHYVVRIKGTPEGNDFASIKRGAFWIAWGLPIPAITGALIGGFANSNPDARLISLIVMNYMYVIVSLFAFSYICAGAYRMAGRSHIHLSNRHIRLLIFGLVSLGVLFCYLVGSKLHGTSPGDALNSYYLPNILVWLTIVIPYLYAWFIGLFGALQLGLVAKQTKGVIYRQALQTLAIGLVIIIIAMCGLQYFRSIVPRTGIFHVNAALFTSYAIYVLHAIGSIMLVIGARKLKKIEDA